VTKKAIDKNFLITAKNAKLTKKERKALRSFPKNIGTMPGLYSHSFGFSTEIQFPKIHASVTNVN
jgi:hypothetical protein